MLADVLAARVVVRAERELAVASDREMLAIACEAGARQVDRFLTSERLVVSAAEKAALAGQADAVEMESFVILAEAARHGVRAVTIRATSDAANLSLPYRFRSGARCARANSAERRCWPTSFGSLSKFPRCCAWRETAVSRQETRGFSGWISRNCWTRG